MSGCAVSAFDRAASLALSAVAGPLARSGGDSGRDGPPFGGRPLSRAPGMASGARFRAGRGRQIRVLFVVNSLAYGGAEKHVVTLINHFDTSEFRLSLAYLKDDASMLDQLNPEQVGGRVLCCAVRHKLDFDAARMLANHIRDESIDIVIAVNSYALAYAALARRLARCTPHLIDIFHSSQLLTLKSRMLMFCYRPIFARCDMLVYVCESQRSYWHARSLRARRDMVIHNGIELSHFTDCYTDTEKIRLRQSYGWSADDFVIGLCAGMRPEKAHADLLAALTCLPPTARPVRCLFIGDGPERARIEQLIASQGLQHQVGITGYLDDVRLAIATCDAMALVSHTETFSLATLESMAMSKPVILTAVGGAAEQIEEGVHGYLVEPANPGQLAQRICDLMRPGLAETMGQAARRRVLAQFSHLRMALAYQTMCKSLNK